MIRAICRRLVELLRSLLGRADSDPDPRAEQDTGQADAGGERDGQDDQRDQADQTDGSNPATPTPEPEPGPDPPADSSGGEDSQGDSEDVDDDNEDDINLDLSGMQNPCVGSDRWDHAPEMPTPPEEPDATIDAKLWPEAGSDSVRAGCEMAAAHLEYVVLEAWGDQYNVDISVATEAVPEHIKDRAGFKEYAQTKAAETPAEHVNVHAGTDGPPGSACCGWGYVNVDDYFDGLTWNPESGCVKRRRWGPVGYGLSIVIHEGLHCIGIAHVGDHKWLKSATVDIRGDRHSPIMGTGYIGIKEDGWHLMELHPRNDQRPDL